MNPGVGEVKAVVMAAAVGLPRLANRTFTWIPLGDSPPHPWANFPSMSSVVTGRTPSIRRCKDLTPDRFVRSPWVVVSWAMTIYRGFPALACSCRVDFFSDASGGPQVEGEELRFKVFLDTQVSAFAAQSGGFDPAEWGGSL